MRLIRMQTLFFQYKVIPVFESDSKVQLVKT